MSSISARIAFLSILFPLLGLVHAQTAQEIFSATGETQGLCVRIGTTNGTLESDLANGGKMVVYGMALNRSDRETAIRTVASRNLQGVVTVDHYSSINSLPFSDNLPNLVVVDLDGIGSGVTEAEVMRIVAPEGAAYMKKGGSWKAYPKAQPAEYGDFNMFEGGAECNMHISDKTIGVPNSLQWIADYPDRDNGFTLNQGSGSRTWHDKHIGVEGSAVDKEGHLWMKCRNAYNGRLLWKLKTLPKMKGDNDYDARGRALCLGDNMLFTYVADGKPLAAVDLENGKILRYFEGGPILERNACNLEFALVLYSDGKVLQAYNKTLSVHDAKTGNLLWKKTDGPYPYACISQNNVYAIQGSYEESGYTRNQNHGAKNRINYDLSTGAQKWSSSASGSSLAGLHYYQGKLVEFRGEYKCCGSTNGHTAVIDPTNGKEIWKKGYPAMASVGTPLFLGNRVYVTSSNAKGMVSYDLDNGASKTEADVSGVHGACKRNVATDTHLLVNGMYFLDKDMSLSKTTFSRAGCGSSVHPANGMVYAPPSGCSCYKMFHGYAAFKYQAPEQPLADNLRLESYAAAPAKISSDTKWPADNEWPMFMSSPRRDRYTEIPLKAELNKKWSVKISKADKGGSSWEDFDNSKPYSGFLTPPTVSGGRVYVSVTHTHEIVSLDAGNGSELWRFSAGGRVDGPPTIYGGLCVFGSADGYMYCLNAVSGELIWRFFAGKTNRKIMAYGQVESPWAHAGSAMIHKGNVYLVAGRFSESDGGFTAYKLDAYTGKVIFSENVDRANSQRGGVRSGTPLNSMLRPMMFDGKLLMMDGIAVHPELNKATSIYHVLDVHSPPAHHWAKFSDLSKDQWDFEAWELGRYHSSKFNYINLESARGGGVSYGYGRNSFSSAFSSMTAKHMTVINKGEFIQIPMSAEGNPGVSGNADLTAMPKVFKTSSGESVRAVAEAGNTFAVVSEIGTSNKLKIATIGTSNVREYDLPAQAVWHGLAVANGEAYVTSNDGSVTCIGNGPAAIKASRQIIPKVLNASQNSNEFILTVDMSCHLSIQIYDGKGEIVSSSKAYDRQLTVSLKNLAGGRYLVEGQAGQSRVTRNITIMR